MPKQVIAGELGKLAALAKNKDLSVLVKGSASAPIARSFHMHNPAVRYLDKETEMNFKPHGDRILVLPRESVTKTASGLVLPEQAQNKQQIGTIVSVGSAVESEDLVDGAEILFSKYGGIEVEIDGDNYLVLQDTDVLLIGAQTDE